MKRRDFLKVLGLGGASLTISSCAQDKLTWLTQTRSNPRKPNIIFILADDLGYGELGCYGQKKIKTPNINTLAAEGMRFTQHYSGSPVCAPSRCVLLTGKHTGHAYIRDNDEMAERGDVWHDLSLEGQRPLPPNTRTIGTILQQARYATAAIGKWGLGGPGSTGEPNKQGFDFFYGYLCQRVAHNYYPPYLWKNNQKVILEGNEYFYPHQKLPEDKDPYDETSYAAYSGKQYSADLMTRQAVEFIRDNRPRPFFLYLAYTIPHVALQVPQDSLEQYEGAFPETPYKGQNGYLPHPTPRAAYAAMITRMDRDIGTIMAVLKELGLDSNSLVTFGSDNGPTYNGGTDSTFFESAGPFRGLKGSLYEGGIRVPLIARWPGKVPAGTTSDHVCAFWDIMPTLAEIVGVKTPKDIDGISLLPTLLGKGRQLQHRYLYWEYARRQAVRTGDWKAIRHRPDRNIELYNLKNDISEQNNVAAENPQIAAEITRIMKTAHSPSRLFPLPGVD
jgi:arylsulfatase